MGLKGTYLELWKDVEKNTDLHEENLSLFLFYVILLINELLTFQVRTTLTLK